MPQAFQINSTRVATREFLFETSALLLPILWATKLLGIRLPGSTDDPAVDSLSSFVIDEAELPAEVRAAFAGDLEYLRGQGFDVAVFHRISLPHIETTIHRATLADDSGAVARLQRRDWTKQRMTKDTRQFETEFRDGHRLITFAGTPDMLMPESWNVLRRKACPIDVLLEQHRERLQTAVGGGRQIIRDEQDLLDYVEREHQELTAFHLERGVFEPGPELESPQPDPRLEPAESDQPDIAPEDALVLKELDKLGKNQASWSSIGWGLALSLAAFATVFAARGDFQMLWMLVPILLVHEAGHWVAMNAFGYKNMRMFFIPFFGAAVSGRNLNVSGWKKAAVALMGPVPSIVASIAIAVVGIWYNLAWVIELSFLSLIINVFNLLPILPLDGGQILQAVLFCRSRFLDVAARVFAVLALFALSVALGAWILIALTIFMAIAIPLSYRLAKTTEDLREEADLSTRSPDGTTVPRETALAIIHRLRATAKTAVPPNMLAQHTQSVFESLNARPPGALATIGLLGVYAFSILIGLVGIGVVSLAKTGDFDRIMEMAAQGPQTPVACGETAHTPSHAPMPLADRTLMIHASGREAAIADSMELHARFPNSEIVLFGPTLFVTLPEKAAGRIDPLFTEFEDRGRRVQVIRGTEPISVMLQGTAPVNEAKFLESELVAFTSVPEFLRPLPPWSEEWITSPKLAQWRKTRELLRRFFEIPASFESDEVAGLWEEHEEAFRRRDDKRIAEIGAEIARLREADFRAAVAGLAAQYDDAESQRVIDAAVPYLREFVDPPDERDEPIAAATPAPTPGQKSLFAIRDLLGAKPGNDIPPLDEWGSQPSAWATREGMVLDFSVSIPRPGDDLVEFTHWLCDHGCEGLRYDIWGLTNH